VHLCSPQFVLHALPISVFLTWSSEQNLVRSKGKAFPLQAWTGPWGSRRLRLQNF
jgi:hypothetical protein